MSQQPHGRAWLEINLDALRENVATIQARVAPCGVIAVLKANAYGLGAERLAATLAASGVAGFAVAGASEALQLIPLGLPVQILGEILPDELPITVAAGVIHPIASEQAARLISAEAVRQNRTVACQCLVDTGMGRLGILLNQAPTLIPQIATLPNLRIQGMYSHFPVASEEGRAFTHRQVVAFTELLAQLRQGGMSLEKIHIANSDAVNHFPFACSAPFNLVRVGIDLHGSFDPQGVQVLKLKSVLTLKARLVAVRQLPAGMSLGYAQTHTLATDRRIGTVSAGYADGLPLALSNRGALLLHGKRCPILGRVSMDYTTIDLEGVPEAAFGDEVICLGESGANAITVEEWAALKGTHPYEILCALGPRVERRYRGG